MNVSRRIVGGYTLNQSRSEQISAATAAPPPTLQTAVVADVIYDVSIIEGDYKTRLQNLVGNPELIDVLPVGAIIAQIISNEGGTSATPYTILFPFFSSHFQQPIQIGEQVHVIYQDFFGRGSSIGYWMSRIHSNRTIEDANYTHLDRRYDPSNNLVFWSTANLKNIRSSPDPNFPNGGNTQDTYTITPFRGQGNPYDDMYFSSSATRLGTQESVPRWNKRPQEFILQGANNTLICLGEDRTGPVSASSGGGVIQEFKGFAGSIDLVAGRGRFPPASPTEDPTRTAARLIRNSRGQQETDKAPFRNMNADGTRRQDNPNEGNPDYENDAARVYITMQSLVDDKFGITSIQYPEQTLPIAQPTNQQEQGTVNRSYVAGKADHIRLFARKNEPEGIEGTILILRQGDSSTDTSGSRDLSYIFMDKNGMNLEADKIYFGTAAHENPNENDSINFNDDEGPYEPWILWSAYRAGVQSMQNQIKQLQDEHKKAIEEIRNQVAEHFGLLARAFDGGGTSAPYGPNSAVAAASVIASNAENFIKNSGTNLVPFVTTLSQSQADNMSNNISKINHSQKLYGSKGGDNNG